tara:strand:+ start:318 stop:827 length:510 start_codon:yes stop_codon:yes gene_type:complete
LTTCSNSFLSQNTITVKKGTQIEGLYVGESYLEQKRFSLHIGNAIFGSRNSGVQYLWFSKEGNACIGTFKRKNKKHAYRVRECAENGNYCNNLHMFNYKINDSFGDKGLSPYLHIEFYEIIATDSININSEEVIYSKCSGELEDNILHFKGNIEDDRDIGIYELYFQED